MAAHGVYDDGSDGEDPNEDHCYDATEGTSAKIGDNPSQVHVDHRGMSVMKPVGRYHRR